MTTPWGQMLRAAALSGVDPAVFWRLSLKEWRMLTDTPTACPRIRRSELERMAEVWPDD